MKEMLSSEQLIEHMIGKGIKFTIISEAEAKDFLKQNNYYMKLAAYRTNYEKQEQECRSKGQYINLEFAYLVELSKLDMLLRNLIIQMCLDIEHHIKLEILNGLEGKEDGYQLIRKFVTENDKLLRKINSHRSSEYCKGLIEKYYPYFPAWVFVELISFGDLAYLYEFYRKTYDVEIMDKKFLNIVRDLRNASAHSNCLINHLSDKLEGATDKRILDYIKSMEDIGPGTIKNNLGYSFVYNFLVLIYVYDNIVKSERLKETRYLELKNFVDNTAQRNSDYFEKNNRIRSQVTVQPELLD